jgi:hypothetical protein
MHPALFRLLAYQAVARTRRTLRGFSSPRRLVLSCLALALAAVWLGNAAVAILLRPPTEPQTLHALIPMGLLAYAAWHLIKVAYRRPEDGIEWTASERELLHGGPFVRRDLLRYRFAGIATSAAIKAGFFILLMLPDLRVPLASVCGVVLALFFLELWRMAWEITAWGLSRRGYAVLRCLIVLGATAAIASSLYATITLPGEPAGATPGSLGLVFQAATWLGGLRDSWWGAALTAPFEVFGQVITAQQYSTNLVGWMSAAVLLVGGMVYVVVRLDAHFQQAELNRERHQYGQLQHARSAARDLRAAEVDLPRVLWLFGVGPIAWRQLLAARHYRCGLLVAFAAPAALSCLPLFSFQQADAAWLNVIGALAFYSFVLLPTALKFDFHRDVDRMVILKTLPLPPISIVVGQLATPVLAASVFQSVVVLIAYVARPVAPVMPLAAMAVFVPLNLLIFALDNLIYLWYPYRLNEESLRIFLRSTLTFTAKGLLFAAAVGLIIAWMAVANWATHTIGGGQQMSRALSALGLWAMLCCAAAAVTSLLVHAFLRFDPSRDVPGS